MLFFTTHLIVHKVLIVSIDMTCVLAFWTKTLLSSTIIISSKSSPLSLVVFHLILKLQSPHLYTLCVASTLIVSLCNISSDPLPREHTNSGSIVRNEVRHGSNPYNMLCHWRPLAWLLPIGLEPVNNHCLCRPMLGICTCKLPTCIIHWADPSCMIVRTWI